MKKNILAQLNEIEKNHDVVILYACESGSRAWGFPSADSDYDVRFIYLRPVKWYLSVEEKRDVIEVPINDQLDINGWDLKKALQLFRKSNPPLLEWLGSPIVYLEKYSIRSQLRDLAKMYYSPISCFHHYLSAARGHYRDALSENGIKLKWYFYTLRTLLAAQWINAGYGVVPTEFAILLERLVTSPTLKAEILELVKVKESGTEKDRQPNIPSINTYIETEMARLEKTQISLENKSVPFETLDNIFQNALSEVWGYQ
ncbi:MAG: nucleotidyltransferase domain-containing protein [Chloroflexi bacterium]|nr:nucleotidyltransferase domain-containing protein [Chloroflexota bacterium]